MSEPKFEIQHLKIDYESNLSSELHNKTFYTIQQGDFGVENYGMRCVRCKTIKPLTPCSNCGSGRYISGKSTDRVLGLFCKGCDKGFTSWTCDSCQTENALNQTFGKTKTGNCFVATAAFGDYDAPEVVFLRSFRDESLSQTCFGRNFIKTYYRVSPPLAATIAKSETLRGMTRKFFLQPVIFLLRFRRRE